MENLLRRVGGNGGKRVFLIFVVPENHVSYFSTRRPYINTDGQVAMDIPDSIQSIKQLVIGIREKNIREKDIWEA